MIKNNKMSTYPHQSDKSFFPIVLIALVAVNFLLFQDHYLGKAIFPWDFIGGYHYQSVSWYLDNTWFNLEPYIPWGDGGFPAAWSLQNGAFYLPLTLMDAARIPHTLYAAVALQCLHHLFGMLGQYLLNRRFNAGWVASLFSALIFGAGVTYFSNAQHVDIVRGVAWLPWLFLVLLPINKSDFGKKDYYYQAFYFSVRIVVIHQFFVSAYPGIVAAVVPFLVIWVLAWNWGEVRGFFKYLRELFIKKSIPPLSAIAFSDLFSIFCAVLISALLLAPKFLPFIDIVIVDGISTSHNALSSLSIKDASLILSTLFGDYEGTLPLEYTMNSIWLSPFALMIIFTCGVVSKDHKLLIYLLIFSFCYLIADLVLEIRLPRDIISRFPVTDHRGIIHTVMCVVLSLSVSSSKININQGIIARIFKAPAGLIVSFVITVSGIVAIKSTNSAGNVSEVIQFIGLTIIILLIAAKFQKHKDAYIISIGLLVLFASYSVHMDSKRSWLTPSSSTSELFYGSRFTMIPAGDRGDRPSEMFRSSRFMSDSWLSNEYATAHFNGNYGLEGYNNLKRSKTWTTRKSTLESSPALKSAYNSFMLERSQVIITSHDATVNQALINRDANKCTNSGVCKVSAVDENLKITWEGFWKNGFKFSIKGNENPLKIIINENDYPGWKLNAKIKNQIVSVKLDKNEFGLISANLPKNVEQIEGFYSRQVYAISKILAILGLSIWFLCVSILFFKANWLSNKNRLKTEL